MFCFVKKKSENIFIFIFFVKMVWVKPLRERSEFPKRDAAGFCLFLFFVTSVGIIIIIFNLFIVVETCYMIRAYMIFDRLRIRRGLAKGCQNNL
jgi:hypothetical protein